MRTTVTLDPDVVAIIQERMRELGVTFKEAINDAVRKSLTRGAAVDYHTPTFDMGVPTINLDRAVTLAGDLEDEELIRKSRMGK